MKSFLLILILSLFISCTSCNSGSAKTDNDTVPDTESSDDLSDEVLTESDEVPDENVCITPIWVFELLEEYDSYFAFIGTGKINKGHAESKEIPEDGMGEIMLPKYSFQLEGFPHRSLSKAAGYFICYSDDFSNPDNDCIQNSGITFILIDDNDEEGESLIIVADITFDIINHLIEQDSEKAEFSPMTKVFSVKELEDDVLKKCIIAVSKLKNDTPEGRIRICSPQDCSINGFLHFGMDTNLTVDKNEIVDLLENIENEQQLCSCSDMTTSATVDCPKDDEYPDEYPDEEPDEEFNEILTRFF